HHEQLALFWRFSITTNSLPSPPLTTGYRLLTTIHPPHAPRLPPPAPRRPPGPAGSDRAQILPRWLLPATDHRIGKDRTGPDLDERPLYFSMRQARRFLRTKSTYSSPLVAAQPLTIPSWQEGLDATFLVFEPRCLHRWRR